MANAEIVAIGSELLLGQIVDTNSAWMADRLTRIGVDLLYTTLVGDNMERMKDIISRAMARVDIVITSGGLGPTQADLTREAVAAAMGSKLCFQQSLMDQIETRFRSRGFVMTANNERQAYIPEGAIPISNPNGTAPAFAVDYGRGVLVSLPGVPFELKWLFDNEVTPFLRNRFNLNETIVYRVLKTAGMGESAVDTLIGHLIAKGVNPAVGVLAYPGEVDVRIAAKAANNDRAYELIRPVEAEVRNLLGTHIFGTDAETMEDTVGHMLKDQGTSVAVYEDLTLGYLAERLHRGAGDLFIDSVICNGSGSIERLLAGSVTLNAVPVTNPSHITDALATAVKARAGTRLGVAVHCMPETGDNAENLGKGRTFISVTDGREFKRRMYNSAGRGIPDRTRASMTALDVLREALLKGMGG